MKVILINGSAKKEGCTAAALGEVARALHEEGIETETIFIGNKALQDCMGCGKCRETGKCIGIHGQGVLFRWKIYEA